jgi:amidase
MFAVSAATITVASLAADLRRGAVSAVELVEHVFARIDDVDRDLRSFVSVFTEAAMADAEAADRRRRDGDLNPLLGVPLAVKDDFDVAGQRTGRGLPGPGQLAVADDPAVGALRRAGAVIVGKTAMPEAALWSTTTSTAHRTTGNPRFPACSPGGSSGGSAAAVAAGLVAGALGTDMGGSVRIPAACCGVVGFKPERNDGYQTAADRRWWGLRTRGVIAHTVADCALLYEGIGGRVGSPGNGPLRIAVSSAAPPPAGEIDATARAALDAAAEHLKQLGHHVIHEDPSFGIVLSAATPRYANGAARELAGVDRAGLEHRTRQVAAVAPRTPSLLASVSRAVAPLTRRRLDAFFRRWDLLLCPAIAHCPPAPEAWSRIGAREALGRQTRFAHSSPVWNVTGQPAIAVPIGDAQGEEPSSVQIVGARGATGALLRVAAELERASSID